MDESGAEVSKEIPVQQATVDAISGKTKKLTGRKFWKDFRVGDAEDNTKLNVLNWAVAPWRRNHTDGKRVGRERYLTIESTESVLGSDLQMEPQNTVTAYKLDTRWKKDPVLYIKRGGSYTFLEKERSEYLKREIELDEEENKGWVTPTEEQAQLLLQTIEKVRKEDTLEHAYSDKTNVEAKEHLDTHTRLAGEVNRILTAAEGFTYTSLTGSHKISLAQGIRTIEISQDPRGAYSVAITEPETEFGELQDRRDSFTSLAGVPLSHNASFQKRAKRGEVTPIRDISREDADADAEQTAFLFDVLELASDDEIKEQLASRGTIQKTAEEILTTSGERGEYATSVGFEQGTVAVQINQHDGGTLFVKIQDYVDEDHPENEPDIVRQDFMLLPHMPLQVETRRFGQEDVEQPTENATPEQTTYLTTLLDELKNNPPTDTSVSSNS